MAYVRIRDDTLWASHIEGSVALQERIKSLQAGETIELEVGGIVGKWEKTRVGRDGRPQQSVKPIETMKEVWKRFQTRRGERIEIREVRTAESYLGAASGTVADEWSSPADEQAFRDL